MKPTARLRCWALLAPVCLAWPATAGAELLSFDATLETRTQELVAGEEVSFDQSFEDFQVTATDLPVRVVSQLVLPTEDESLLAMAQGFADFFEPVVNLDGNPEELGLEANCFSIDTDVSYHVTTSVIEQRTIRFTRLELGTTSDDEREIESSVFLSGAVIVWSEDPDRDLSGLGARMRFTIEQLRPGPNTTDSEDPAPAETVFNALLDLDGLPGGEVSAASAGDLQFFSGGTGLVLDGGTPSPVLEDVFDVMGRVHILLIPEQEITYRYFARPAEEFELEATFAVEVTNLPGGTGVSAVFGRGFEALADTVQEAFGDVDGAGFEAGINQAQAAIGSAEPARELADQPTGQLPLCGAIGLEAFGLAALTLLPFRRRR